jgi:hypothetical protein
MNLASPSTPAKVSGSSKKQSIHSGGIRHRASGYVGWIEANINLHSIMAHHLAMALLLVLEYMNDGNEKKSAEDFESIYLNAAGDDVAERLSLVSGGLANLAYISDLNVVQVLRDALEGFQETKDKLKVVIEKWLCDDGSETDLTAAIAKVLEDCDMSNEMHSLSESRVEGGRLDNLLVRKVDCAPVAVFEFGLKTVEYWEKYNQGVLYMEALECVDGITGISPKKRKHGTDHKVRPSRFEDKPALLIAATYDEKSKDCQISVFLCWRKGEKPSLDQAVSKILLWRKRTPGCNAGQLAQQLANIVVASRCLCSWHSVTCNSRHFEVLSPVCCRVKHGNVRLSCSIGHLRVRFVARPLTCTFSLNTG